MRTFRIAIACFVAAGTIPWGSQAATPLVGVLKNGDGLFWGGGRVGAAADRIQGATADCPTGRCYSYALKIAERGKRLRVAIDVPQRNDAFQLVLVSPSGRRRP